jgi:uncharacterized protein with HEPN domain
VARKLINIKLYLLDIQNSIQKIFEYIGNLSYDNFQKDHRTIDAVVRNLEIIGEAASQLPRLFKSKHKDIEWRNLIDFRNVIVHEYFGVNLEIVWDIVKNELPFLDEKFKELIKKIDNGEIPIEWE